jgi:TetR/AcrR family transcriptional regulator, repressor of fatR-cypB operon
MVASTQHPPVRKERERLLRRHEILFAARAVFAEKGYANATLDEIAERAEFAKGTLYNYFDSKERLFDAMVAEILDDMTEIAEHAIAEGGGVRQQFYHYATHIIDYYKAHEDVFRVLIREMYRMQLEEEQAHLSELMTRVRNLAGILAKVLRKEIAKKNIIKEDPETLAQFFVAMIHNRVIRCSVEGKGIRVLDTEKESAFLVKLFFEGAALP